MSGAAAPSSKSTGRLYGLNTLGAIWGRSSTTAWLIPALGAQRSIIVLAGLQAALGAPGDPPARRPRPVAATGERDRRLGAARRTGVRAEPVSPRSRSVYARQEPGKLLALVEGSGAAVTVHQRGPHRPGDLDQRSQRRGDEPSPPGHPEAPGPSAGLLASQPPVRSSRSASDRVGPVTRSACIARSSRSRSLELNPDVLAVATEWFADVNHGVLDDPRVRVRIVDAKSHVAVTDQTYDLILSDSTHPRFRGNAALYARDYFANCCATAPARRHALDLAAALRDVGGRRPGNPQEHPVGLPSCAGLVRQSPSRTRTRS